MSTVPLDVQGCLYGNEGGPRLRREVHGASGCPRRLVRQRGRSTSEGEGTRRLEVPTAEERGTRRPGRLKGKSTASRDVNGGSCGEAGGRTVTGKIHGYSRAPRREGDVHGERRRSTAGGGGQRREEEVNGASRCPRLEGSSTAPRMASGQTHSAWRGPRRLEVYDGRRRSKAPRDVHRGRWRYTA